MTGPTLIIDVEPSIGLTRQMVEQLLEWASSVGKTSEVYCNT